MENANNTTVGWVWKSKKEYPEEYLSVHSLIVSDPEDFGKKLEKFLRDMDENSSTVNKYNKVE